MFAAHVPGCGPLWWVARMARMMPVLAAVMLLTSCLGAGGTPDTPATTGSGTTGTGDTGGNGYGGDGGDASGGSSAGGPGGNGGVGGAGGDGHGGWGGDGYGGDGGDARGGSGVSGADGADGVDGVPGSGHSATGVVAGSGRLTSRVMDLSRVTSVVVGAGFVVRLKLGAPEQATIRMDDNLVDRVEAAVVGDQLRLGLTPGAVVRNATLSAEVTVSQLDRLATGGSSRVMLDSPLTSPAPQLIVAGSSVISGPVAVGQLQATVSGAATLALSGQVRELRISAAGTSHLPLADLIVRRLDVTLSGSSRGTVTVRDTLAVRATGASVLHYRGTPTITRQQTSGASSIVRDSP